MSRIGKMPVAIPEGINVEYKDNYVFVKGPKGELKLLVKPGIKIAINDNQVIVTRESEEKKVKSLHGTVRNLINNMIIGVKDGYSKSLKLVGTGYRVKAVGKNLEFSLGFSHPKIYEAIDGIELKVEGQDKVIVSGIDKYLVGQTAASIRSIRPPEPYKGKGIRYEDEQIIKKAGKTAKSDA